MHPVPENPDHRKQAMALMIGSTVVVLIVAIWAGISLSLRASNSIQIQPVLQQNNIHQQPVGQTSPPQESPQDGGGMIQQYLPGDREVVGYHPFDGNPYVGEILYIAMKGLYDHPTPAFQVEQVGVPMDDGSVKDLVRSLDDGSEHYQDLTHPAASIALWVKD